MSLNKTKGKYTGVTPQRLRTIIQPFMKFCGINLEKYKSHVCRAVGASSRVACGQDESTVQSFMILASKKTFHENYLFLNDVLSTAIRGIRSIPKYRLGIAKEEVSI